MNGNSDTVWTTPRNLPGVPVPAEILPAVGERRIRPGQNGYGQIIADSTVYQGPNQYSSIAPPQIDHQPPPRRLHLNLLVNELNASEGRVPESVARQRKLTQYNKWVAAGHSVTGLRNGNGIVRSSLAPPAEAGISPSDHSDPGSPDSFRSTSGLNDSSQRLVPRKQISRETLLRVILHLCLFIAAIITAFLILTYYYVKNLPNMVDICQTQECIRTAASLLRSIDHRTSPCSDFYRYTCGGWAQDHPTPPGAFGHDWFFEGHQNIMRSVREILKSNVSKEEPWAMRQARNLYEACMDFDRVEELGVEPMLSALESVELPRVPPLSEPSSANWSWVRTAVLARRLFNKDLLVGLLVLPDEKNRSINRIQISKHRIGSPLPGLIHLEKRIRKRRMQILKRASLSSDALGVVSSEKDESANNTTTNSTDNLDEDEKRHIGAFLAYVGATLTLLLEENATIPTQQTLDTRPGSCIPTMNDFDPPVKEAAKSVLEFQRELYKLPENETKESEEAVEMWVWELQNLTDSIPDPGSPSPLNWKEYIEFMFLDVKNTTLDLQSRDRLLVEDIEFFKGLASLLAKTPLRTLQLALWWEIVELLAPYTTTQMRMLRMRYLETASQTSAARARDHFCSDTVNSLWGMAVSVNVVNTTSVNKTRAKVEEMIDDVRWAFEGLVAELDWMDGPTKSATLEKARAMHYRVAFPTWILDAKKLNEYYEGLNMSKDVFLEDLLHFQEVVTMSNLATLRNGDPAIGWASDPTDVNAFHTFQENTVTIPAGILQFPFYDLGLEALNYGAIGAILGHELTHGFDNIGRLYDKNGNKQAWWSNKTIEEYENRTTCFVGQYSDFYISEVEMNVDGELSLGENIADNGGLHESVRAYRHLVRRRGYPEPVLPGMTNYTHEQLIFLAYVNVWCESWSKESLRFALHDEHPPNFIRTIGVLQNSEDFAQAWNCPKGSPMNPDRNRCRVW